MSTQDKASNKLQDIKGKVKETVGKATRKKDLEREGKTDQAKATVKDLGEEVKGAATDIKDAVTDK